MTFELRLLATPKAVPELRHHLRHHTYEVRLCATELVTNVIDHVGEGTPVTVRVLDADDGHTRVEVTDPDPRALPVLLRAGATDEHGRGMALLDALTQRWGVEQGADRKTVWCELNCLAERGRSSQGAAGTRSP
ncbi:ATP-binding protein [Streptomyces hokutonensis]|uniref:ATP-binding protein n=1 Tax=Streptomyces hokutonensis TaxID=1306990 RepID=UPI00036C0366|nr:ATP-binding protein [Streptomyces hokutonensis]